MDTKSLAALGVALPEILVPGDGVDIRNWSVIACDQYTSEPEYWERVARETAGIPSTFHCVFPETYLENGDPEGRIRSIRRAMTEYAGSGVLKALPPGIVLVERSTPFHESRRGIVLALDLDLYDFRPGSSSLIRPTEGTILERLPIRVRIRRDAPLEFPHILILVDDPEKTVIEPLFADASSFPIIYDSDLMAGAGHVTGRFIPAHTAAPRLAGSLEALLRPGRLRNRYGREDRLLFAVGDGNHSLAAAKSVWEEKKLHLSPAEAASHPGRFALVEVVNLFDPGIQFEPIHRILTGVDPSDFFRHLRSRGGCMLTPAQPGESEDLLGGAPGPFDDVAIIAGGRSTFLTFPDNGGGRPAGVVDRIIDEYIGAVKKGRTDYIHGRESLVTLCENADAVGFLLPSLRKDMLFPIIARDGVLPRKAFSIGEASEKRFYLEGRRIDVCQER